MIKFQNIPFKIKICAIISIIVFVVCITGTIIVGTDYDKLEKTYITLNAEETKIEEYIKTENNLYYAEILNNAINRDIVYNVVDKLYKYKLYINGYLMTDENVISGIEIKSNSCTIKIEEYFELDALEVVPLSVLYEYSYLRTKGKGSSVYETTDGLVPISELLTYQNVGSNVTVTRECLNLKTVIIFEYKEIASPNNLFTINLYNGVETDTVLKTKLNLTWASFEVRYVK